MHIEVSSTDTEDQYPAKALARAGIQRPYQVLMWVPRKYRDFTVISSATDLAAHVEQKVLLRMRVSRPPTTITDRQTLKPMKGRFRAWVTDETGYEHKLTVFGALRFSPWNRFPVGAEVHIEAKVTEFNGQCYLNGPELIPPAYVGRIIPIYAGKAGVIGAEAVGRAAAWAIGSPREVADACIAIRQAFGAISEESVLAAAGISGSLEMLLYQLHRPISMEAGEWALTAAKSMAVASIRHCAAHMSMRPMRIQSAIRIEDSEIDLAIRALPFSPTRGKRSQEAAVRDIARLLAEPRPMDAILTADVGVGKTLCYMIPAVLAQRHGAKVAVLVPNTLLADGIASEFRHCFPNAPIAIVTDAHKKAEIDWSANPILIGTTRLFSVTAKQRWHPDLLVIDEQQKLSAEQREKLCALDTNVLEASATPMPRTLALLRYGNKAQIEVDVCHAQKSIVTTIVAPEERAMVFRKMRDLVAAGEQVAVIYPRVQASKDADSKSVIAAAEMWERHFPGNVVTIHGRMSDIDKLEAMRQAKACERQVIVASSIVEIGVTIPRLRGLMTVNADRYGVSTLHQMRGRLARHGGDGWCWLYLPDEVDEETSTRVKLLERTINGFELAEYDMELRGFGTLSEEMGELTESGTTRTLFRGIDLKPEDFADRAS